MTISSTRVGEIIAGGSSIQIDRINSSPLDIHPLRLTSVSENTPLSFVTSLRIPLPPGEVRAKR